MLNRIKELREEAGYTQIRLSIELEVAQETVSAYENGKHYPSLSNLLKLREIFHASMDYIMGLSDVRLPAGQLSEEEERLIAMYRRLPEGRKESLFFFLAGLANQSTDK